MVSGNGGLKQGETVGEVGVESLSRQISVQNVKFDICTSRIFICNEAYPYHI